MNPLLLLLLCLSLAGCALTPTHRESLHHDGVQRYYRLHFPQQYDKAKVWPIVLAFHGGWGTAELMEKMAGFNALADKHGFIAVYPDGIRRHWNDGRGDKTNSPTNSQADDVGFVARLIDHLASQYRIDEKRIYATGISNGGIFSYRLAVELSEKIAAIGVVTGALGVAQSFQPKSPVAVVQINGTEDKLVPWEGGSIANNPKLGGVLSTEETILLWAKANGCSSAPEISRLPSKNPSDETHVYKTHYTKCRDNADVVLYRIEGGGHTWPGADHPGWYEMLAGRTSRHINATEVIWEFFAAHPKP